MYVLKTFLSTLPLVLEIAYDDVSHPQYILSYRTGFQTLTVLHTCGGTLWAVYIIDFCVSVNL
jgi:hypothetical protein